MRVGRTFDKVTGLQCHIADGYHTTQMSVLPRGEPWALAQ
jgi:hypothetical protein